MAKISKKIGLSYIASVIIIIGMLALTFPLIPGFLLIFLGASLMPSDRFKVKVRELRERMVIF